MKSNKWKQLTVGELWFKAGISELQGIQSQARIQLINTVLVEAFSNVKTREIFGLFYMAALKERKDRFMDQSLLTRASLFS